MACLLSGVNSLKENYLRRQSLKCISFAQYFCAQLCLSSVYTQERWWLRSWELSSFLALAKKGHCASCCLCIQQYSPSSHRSFHQLITVCLNPLLSIRCFLRTYVIMGIIFSLNTKLKDPNFCNWLSTQHWAT